MSLAKVVMSIRESICIGWPGEGLFKYAVAPGGSNQDNNPVSSHVGDDTNNRCWKFIGRGCRRIPGLPYCGSHECRERPICERMGHCTTNGGACQFGPCNEQHPPDAFPSLIDETGNVSTSMRQGGNEERNSAFEKGSEANISFTFGQKSQHLDLIRPLSRRGI